MDSSKTGRGKILASLLASILFPDPGDPVMSTWWEPAAAISNALLTWT